MTSTPSAAPAAAAIACRYLLVIHIPLFIDSQGRRWIDRLWAVDLYRHTDYIRDLTVACPFHHAERPDDAVAAEERGLRFVEIAYPTRSLTSLLRAPLTLWQLWRLVGRYDFVHSIYGTWWPFATPYLVNLAARLRGRCLMINVEASPWRIMRGEKASAFRRFKARLAEALNRWTISLCDLAMFTHEGYRRDLMAERVERGHVLHASWIDEAAVLDDEVATARWQARQRDGGAAPRLLFAGRLTDDKGIHVMLDAMQQLRADGRTQVHLSIIGAGDLAELCREHAARSDERVKIELLEPVSYGEPLFALLRRFDALLVPSLADEQPRIVYDAYSQALPVLASSTPGLQTCVSDGVNGRLFAPADARALAEIVRWAAREPEALRRLGLAALDSARATTHQGMHRRRHALIARTLAARGLT
jgi:glycosyltransferase involved in cell wall biosynthesis